MPLSARFDATDKSMPRVMITIICPSASMHRIEVSLRTLVAFSKLAKAGA